MQTLADEIIIVGAASLLLLLITTFVIAVVIIHEKRRVQFVKEKELLEYAFHQELLKSELEVKEEILSAISREIHDNIGQSLALTKLNLFNIKLDNLDKTREKLNDTNALVSSAINDLRNLAHLLSGDYIMNESLPNILKTEFDRIKKLGAFKVELTFHGVEVNLDKHRQLILFRIIQEAITNILRHAQPSTISCKVSYDHRKVCIVLSDDGTGFELEAGNAGAGIQNMKHRCKLLKGSMEILSQKGLGTTIKIAMPLNDDLPDLKIIG